MNNRGLHSASFSISLIRAHNKSINSLRRQQRSLQTILKPIESRTPHNKESAFTFRHRKLHKLLLFNSDRELENSSQNIYTLNKELIFLQSKFKSITHFDQEQIGAQIKQAQMQKQQIEKSIANLKRTIQHYGNILIKAQGQKQKGDLLNLQKDQTFFDNKLSTIRRKYQESVQKNAKKTLRIQRIQQKIQFYQSQYSQIIGKMQAQTLLEAKLKERLQHIEQRKKKSKTQLTRFQLSYFKKLTDLKYQMNGCQAIDNKIKELQERMYKDKVYIAELNAYLSTNNSQINPPKKRGKRTRVYSEGNSKNDKQ